MSYNAAPKEFNMHQYNNQPFFSFIQEVNEEPPPKYEPNKEQIKHEEFKCLKEVSSIHP